MVVNVYQHFRKDEHPFIDSVENWINRVENEYSPVLTGFLDPRQQYILETLLKSRTEDIYVAFSGGNEAAERKRGLLYPDYYKPSEVDFEIETYDILYPKKFSTLKHSQILGTLLNMGIRRDVFGDINTDGENWQILLDKQMASYITHQVEKISKITVRFEENQGDLIIPVDEWVEETAIASSQRLDTMISEVFSTSRQRSKSLVEASKVKINWTIEERADTLLEVYDIVSVRGFGRFRIESIEGITKKNKVRLTVSIIKNLR